MNVARCDVNRTALPSGVKLWTMSAPGCHVRRVGAPPVTGTMKTSALPSYCALNAIVRPSGENTGFDSTPSSVVSRWTSVFAGRQIGDEQVACVDESHVSWR